MMRRVTAVALTLIFTPAACAGCFLRPLFGSPSPAPPTGDIIQFGGYDWRVLDERDGKALIITEKIIEFRPYHGLFTDVSWAGCDLRAYLNGEFYEGFNETDRARIIETANENADNQWYGAHGGEATADKIFLLSLEETVRYFGDSGQLADRPQKKPVWIDDRYNGARLSYTVGAVPGYETRYPAGTAWYWWLRSPGGAPDGASAVGSDGRVWMSGYFVSRYDFGVRPALWLDMDGR
jgi:hypothetical protein